MLTCYKSTSWKAERAFFVREAADRERRSREPRHMLSDEGLFWKSTRNGASKSPNSRAISDWPRAYQVPCVKPLTFPIRKTNLTCTWSGRIPWSRGKCEQETLFSQSWPKNDFNICLIWIVRFKKVLRAKEGCGLRGNTTHHCPQDSPLRAWWFN